MSTQIDATPAPAGVEAARADGAAVQPDIKLYSHSPILYWWPVWAVGFVLALLTYLDGGRMAYLPVGTRVEGHTITAPAEQVAFAPPFERVAHNPYLGTYFFLTLLVVFVCSNVQLRGLWALIALLVIALLVTIFSLYGLWDVMYDWFSILHIRLNLAGYVFLSAWLLAIWLVSVFVFDRRTYIIFSAGQVRVRDEIGQAERVYDVTNMTFLIQPNIFLRHRVLGFYGAGDLIIRTGGPHPEVLEWPNVLFARARLRQIELRLKAREVV
ncbi:MAG: hypothetical protein L0Z62_07025 [Gemmataceae bacterium]|nr:hypothetical protein [Gemmataceae bacterium]